ncbi:EamA family transporter [Cytobacillus horneckiae]|uniref:EamA family transporter n=1 Tax=Cytobacillus horneckiae TaxID=549687 RepID=A0A2N0ZC38_9BACI|nr:EamA family transporter [Cytobacillus horneckiae]MCM3177444.1 EamA family transporter [Cytobacillus horneckiae]MEC1155994.1 EamA family transporter [Cytobacillus horneckiae]MED2939730.1 EamA family transporter [Cytobacillus horneckiae]PKG27045.1 EamA family transporter [Cytobacillus horneckiae]
MNQWIYPLAVFLGGACFGVLSTFVKLAYGEGFVLAEVSGSQFIAGTLLIWLLLLFTKKKKISVKRFLFIALSGIPMGLTGIFYYQSLQTLEASLAIIFLFQFVWIGTLLEYLIDHKKPTNQKLIAIFILLIGSILAAGVLTNGFSNLSLSGVAWGLLSACSFSAFAYISGTVGRELPPIQRSAIFALGGLLITMVIFPPVFLFDLQTVTAIAPYGLFLGLFGVMLPPLLFAIGMPHVGAGLGTILTSSELPVALFMSLVFLGENLQLVQWIGVCIIIVGIIFGNFPVSKRKERSITETSEKLNAS